MIDMWATVTRITTTVDQSIKLTLEIDKDMVPADVFTLLNKIVRITGEQVVSDH